MAKQYGVDIEVAKRFFNGILNSKDLPYYLAQE